MKRDVRACDAMFDFDPKKRLDGKSIASFNDEYNFNFSLFPKKENKLKTKPSFDSTLFMGCLVLVNCLVHVN